MEMDLDLRGSGVKEDSLKKRHKLRSEDAEESARGWSGKSFLCGTREHMPRAEGEGVGGMTGGGASSEAEIGERVAVFCVFPEARRKHWGVSEFGPMLLWEP